MGWDIIIIGNHNLDTSNIQSLAMDLYSRLDINIEYGYYPKLTYNKEQNRIIDQWKKFKQLGKLEKKHLKIHYQLSDNLFSLKQIRKILGDDTSKLKWKGKAGWKDDMNYFLNNYLRARDHEYYNLSILNDEKFKIKFRGIAIYNNTIIIRSLNWSRRWFPFAEAFCKEGNKIDPKFKILNKNRIELKNICHKLGCKEIIYFPDQGPTEFIFEYLDKPWQELRSSIKNQLFYEDYVNGGYYDLEFKKQVFKEYNEKEKQLQLNIPNFFKKNQALFPDETSIQIFYDNFSDLI